MFKIFFYCLLAFALQLGNTQAVSGNLAFVASFKSVVQVRINHKPVVFSKKEIQSI